MQHITVVNIQYIDVNVQNKVRNIQIIYVGIYLFPPTRVPEDADSSYIKLMRLYLSNNLNMRLHTFVKL